jgi:hypothetical protein
VVSAGEYFFQRRQRSMRQGAYTLGQSTIGEWNPKTRFGSN